MTAGQWTKTPKGNVTVALTAYLLIASTWSQDWVGIVNGIIAVGVSVVLDILACLVEQRKRIIPDGAVITGLIIALILSTTTSWTIVAATAAIAILSKHILVYKKKPIFNPAVAGLLLSIPFYETAQSWWGAFGDLPAWTMVFLLIGGYAITSRVHKFPQVFAFLGTFFILLFFMGYFGVEGSADAFRPPFINAALFFGFFMLTDLPTSPAKGKGQIVFGILTAAVGAVVYGLFGGLTYLFIGLLVGNLYHVLRTRSSSKNVPKGARTVRKI